MSKSRTAHRGRVAFQPQSSSTQNLEATLEDGSGDHKKAAREARTIHGNGAHASRHDEMEADEKVEHHGMDPVVTDENAESDATGSADAPNTKQPSGAKK
jgi:hypothetical protein